MENKTNDDDETSSGPISDFDQTNGKAPGLEGDDDMPQDDVRTPLLTEMIDEAADRLGIDGDDERGDSPADRDPAVTEYSEDDQR